ncbi:MAG: hypothetical protein GY765_13135, partial [bacterium]|nr:hypothetical protein [bacterium]
PIRTKPRGDLTYGQFLGEVKENVLGALENQDFQFEDLVKALGLQRQSGRDAVFEVVFNMNNVEPGTLPEDRTVQNDTLKVTPYPFEHGKTVFDLILSANEGAGRIFMSLLYSTELFEHSTAQSMVDRYCDILNQIAENREITLKDITLTHNLLAAASGDRMQDAQEDDVFAF